MYVVMFHVPTVISVSDVFDNMKVEVMVMNRYYGHGVPDYDSLGEKRGEWSVQVEGDG